ncbi:MAG: hypothetical protein ACI8X5_004228, partial [Planctomycetota bacterium]
MECPPYAQSPESVTHEIINTESRALRHIRG